jgi:predicted  nucleic acid-binding Zn-ribbon protein
MNRMPLIALIALSLLSLAAARETELDRARRDLRDAERALERALADKAAARVKFDRFKAGKGVLQDEIEAIKAQLADARRPSDPFRALVARKQIEHDRIMGDVGMLSVRVADLDKRVAEARGHSDAVRGRFIREFESSREFRAVAADADRARAILEQTKAGILRDLPRTQRYRWAESDMRYYDEEVRRLRASRFTDPRRLADAERALADARRNLDQMAADTLANDPEMQRAGARLTDVEARQQQMRAGFATELDRRREVRDAAVAIATAEHQATRTRQELAGAQAACAAVKAELDRHTAHLIEVDRQFAAAGTDLERRHAEVRKLAEATFAAQDEFRQAGEAEDAARAACERAAKRVEWLAKRQDR